MPKPYGKTKRPGAAFVGIPADIAPGPLLSIREAADLLRCHHSTIRKLIIRKKLRASLLGGIYRISVDDLNVALRKHLTMSEPA